MNPDILAPGERCASTSNRNFEGRQGRGGRTHLVQPDMAAAAAITGHFTDIRTWKHAADTTLRHRTDARRRRLALMIPINILTSTRRAAAAAQHRHRPDHPQAVPQAHRAHRLRRLPLLRLAPHPGQAPDDRVQAPPRTSSLNKPAYAGAKILIAEKNFGCGSSREHAAWAIDQFGFLAVIAPSFADIFYSNAGKNGIILVRLDDAQVELLIARSTATPATKSPSTSNTKPSPTTPASTPASTSTPSASTASSTA